MADSSEMLDGWATQPYWDKHNVCEQKSEGQKMARKGSIGNIILVMVGLVVGLSLTGVVQAAVTTAVASGSGKGNLTGAAKTLCELIPLFWVIMLLGIAVAAIYMYFK